MSYHHILIKNHPTQSDFQTIISTSHSNKTTKNCTAQQQQNINNRAILKFSTWLQDPWRTQWQMARAAARSISKNSSSGAIKLTLLVLATLCYNVFTSRLSENRFVIAPDALHPPALRRRLSLGWRRWHGNDPTASPLFFFIFFSIEMVEWGVHIWRKLVSLDFFLKFCLVEMFLWLSETDWVSTQKQFLNKNTSFKDHIWRVQGKNSVIC